MVKKRMMVVVFSVLVAVMSTYVVYAVSGYDRMAGYAGNVYAVCEVGFDENDAYAYVQASDYVDARMQGFALFISGTRKVMSGGFEQNTYGSIGVSDFYDVYLTECEFWVSGDEGDYHNTGFAER